MLAVQRRGLNFEYCAEVTELQTRVVQVHVLARVWGFESESLLRHHE